MLAYTVTSRLHFVSWSAQLATPDPLLCVKVSTFLSMHDTGLSARVIISPVAVNLMLLIRSNMTPHALTLFVP